jgi:DNA repair photolyase
MGKVKKSHGNMYEWTTHMWSPGVGCPHQCSYCYVKQNKELPETMAMERPFPYLGSGRTIFVGFECDLFAEGVAEKDIMDVLAHCNQFPDNLYVFQSKNPFRMNEFVHYIPRHSVLGTTIETNKKLLLEKLSKAPASKDRATGLRHLQLQGFPVFITVEPIMDFKPKALAHFIISCKPSFVNIGADSKGHNLPEPSKKKVEKLIAKLQDAQIEIRNKTNLTRLLT